MKKVIGVGILIIVGLVILLVATLYNMHEIKTSDNVITISDKSKVNFEKYNLTIKLNKILDNRCPKDVNCIRAGELIYYFEIKYKNKKYNKKLDSEQKTSITIDDITISIKDYNENNVTLVITKK